MDENRLVEIKLRTEGLVSENWYYDGETVCESAQGNPVITANNWGDIRMSKVLGEFIANARQDVPDLIAEVERLQNVIWRISDYCDMSIEETGKFILAEDN